MPELQHETPLDAAVRDLDAFFREDGDLSADNYRRLGHVLFAPRLRDVLRFVVDDGATLARVAARSYVHSQGFRKIILHDSRSFGYRLRLHLWPRQRAAADGAPLTEMKHLHKWGFASRCLLGGFEDHRYVPHPMTAREADAYGAFEHALADVPVRDVPGICTRLDALESSRLSDDSLIVKLSGGREALHSDADLPRLARRLGLEQDVIRDVLPIYRQYANARDPSTGRETYRPFRNPVSLGLESVLRHRAGELRFHPIALAHRLVIDPCEDVATVVVTGPAHAGAVPGEYVRTARDKRDVDVRDRTFITPEALRAAFVELIDRLAPAPDRNAQEA